MNVYKLSSGNFSWTAVKNTMTKTFSSLFISLVCLHSAYSTATRSPKIAIVGGGIGGTATAYFLRELLGSVPIDLYEANKIGGRLATVTINNEEYETGGAIIHPKNKYMLDFLKLSGKQKRKNVFSKFGMYDGTEFVFTDSEWELVTVARLLWRYGYGPFKLQHYIGDMLKSFARIYTLQANMQCFATVGEMLKAMSPSFADDLRVSTKKGFQQAGFSEKVVDELVMATLTANYGQGTDVHKFVGLVSVAGADGALWAVEGGNKRLPETLLDKSGATLVRSKVARVSYRPETRDYSLEHAGSDEASVYDIVVMATPLTPDVSNVTFDLPTEVEFQGSYHRTVCTIVVGTIDHAFFGVESADEMIDEILTVNLDSFYNSVGRINAVNVRKGADGKKSNVWKLFSQTPISDAELKSVFRKVESVNVVDWLAYPRFSSASRNDTFVLHPGLYHLNAIEWAASAMEMSAIGAKNVALLAFKTWYGVEYRNPNERFVDEF